MHVVIIMDTIKIILYFSVIFIGFLINFISVVIYNKKYRVLNFENLIISYILFIISFLVFSKIGYIIINRNLIIDNKVLPNIVNFFLFGYAFIGGYIGLFVYSYFSSKIFKCNKLDIMKIYIPNMLILYSILKIGCFINGCCKGIIPIQIIESICNLIAYIYICILVKNNKNILNISIIIFGLLRLILSIFRIYNALYIFVIVEVMCIIIIIYGLILKTGEVDK